MQLLKVFVRYGNRMVEELRTTKRREAERLIRRKKQRGRDVFISFSAKGLLPASERPVKV